MYQLQITYRNHSFNKDDMVEEVVGRWNDNSNFNVITLEREMSWNYSSRKNAVRALNRVNSKKKHWMKTCVLDNDGVVI